MSRLILIRHSHPDVVPGVPAHKWRLSSEGMRRSQLLADAVAELQPASLHSSAEAKAMETAEVIVQKTGLTVSIDPGFNEHDRSKELFVDEESFRDSVCHALSRPVELVYGSETVAAAVQRFSDALQIAERFSVPGDMAVVSHGTVISGFVAMKLELDPVALWERLGMPGIIVLNWPDPHRIELQQKFE